MSDGKSIGYNSQRLAAGGSFSGCHSLFASQPQIGYRNKQQERDNRYINGLPPQGMLNRTGTERSYGDGPKHNEIIQGLGFGLFIRHVCLRQQRGCTDKQKIPAESQ